MKWPQPLIILTGVLIMTSTTAAVSTTAYDFSFQSLGTSKPLPLSEFKGKVLLVVNTASKCGFTPQYAELESLYLQYKDKGLVILGVPSNDFANQEPGTAKDIAKFCQINYGVTFPLTDKVDVKGEKAHPFYLWVKKQMGFGSGVKWNFQKYLINCKGEVVTYFYPTTSPKAPRVIKAIDKALAEPACRG